MSIYREGESANLTKKAHIQTGYNIIQVQELAKCMVDPLFFMENFMKIQHPTRGRLPFIPYDFQREMIETIADNRYSILLTARQMGKCLTKLNKVKLRNKNGEEIEMAIGDFYEWQRFKEWAKTVPELQEYLQRNKNK